MAAKKVSSSKDAAKAAGMDVFGGLMAAQSGVPSPVTPSDVLPDDNLTGKMAGHRDDGSVSHDAEPPPTREEQAPHEEEAPTVPQKGGQSESRLVGKPVRQSDGKIRAKAAAKATPVTKEEIVAALAATKKEVVSLKIPEGINHWLNSYCKSNWEDKVLKQDIVTRGIELAILELMETQEE